MDELFTLHPNGLFLRREALEHGYNDRDLADARRHGAISRVRHGSYVPAQIWSAADSTRRHRLAAQAVLLTHDGRVALSHTTGAVAHGLRLWRPELEDVHVVRLAGAAGRKQAGVVYHQGGGDVVTMEDGLVVLGATECALGAASLTSVAGGVTVLDSLLDLGHADQDSLWSAYRYRAKWPYSRILQVSVRMARPGAQSVGESLSRHMMWVQHLPEPQLQFKVYDHSGRLIGITDFAWPEYRLLGEFDGKIKYGRVLTEGQDPSDVVFAEKVREDELREATGFGMIRYIWPDIFRPAASGARTRRLMHLAA